MGFRPDPRGDAVAVFDAEWALHSREVRRLHERLFYRPLLESVARLPREELRLSKGSAMARMAALGFARPEQALGHLEALTRGVSRTASIQRALLPVLLREFADAPDPDAGLLAYRQVSDALGTTPWYLRLLRDEGKVATRLAFVLGSSRYAAAMLVRAPEALRLLADDADLVPRDRADLALEFTDAALRQSADDGRVEGGRRRARVAAGWNCCASPSPTCSGWLDVDTVGHALADVTDATVQAALAVALRHAPAPHRPFAVIGMGRLGGRETGYGSDADVLFVVDAAIRTTPRPCRGASPWRAPLRRLLSSPSPDPAVQLDVDLRPEGRDGPVVRSLRSYAAYYARWSELWEAQALLRARPIAGDPELGGRFLELVDPVRYPADGLDAEQTRRDPAHQGPGGGRAAAAWRPTPRLHTKLGRGGLVRRRVDGAAAATACTVHESRRCARPRRSPRSRRPPPPTCSTGTTPTCWRRRGGSRPGSATPCGWSVTPRATRSRPAGPCSVCSSPPPVTPPTVDPGVVVDEYRRVTRRAREVVERVFYDRPVDDRPI